MSQVLHALMEQAARVRIYDGQRMSVRVEGVVIGYCDAPMLIIRCDDGTLVHESSQLPREVVPVEELPPVAVASGPPTRWGKGQIVAHLITGRVGEVQGVDFEESLVTVEWRGSDLGEPWPSVARMENVREVTP